MLFQQPWVQFGLQATCPLKDYPRNTHLPFLSFKSFPKNSSTEEGKERKEKEEGKRESEKKN